MLGLPALTDGIIFPLGMQSTGSPAGTSTYTLERVEAHESASVFGWGSALLRWRRLVLALAVIGGLLGLVAGLLSPRLYVTTATFIPQSSEGGSAGLALAASQLGIRVPTGNAAWGPAIYAALLRSRGLTLPIVLDTFVVPELAGAHIPLAELLGIEEPDAPIRGEYAARVLERHVDVSEVVPLGAVRIVVETKWPSVSLGIAERLVDGVNDFNLKTRKSQAAAERQFVENRAKVTADSLRAAESRLLAFLEQNRTIVAPQLVFEREKLERDVSLKTQVYTSLLQGREEAHMREIRDTPVITMLETPRAAAVAKGRRSIQKAFLGAVAGLVVGALIAFFAEATYLARRRPTVESQEFFRLLEQATPRFFMRLGANR